MSKWQVVGISQTKGKTLKDAKERLENASKAQGTW